ncbi:hypothetical protein GY45DRAFT_1369313 [Cubamyces sp. BRFM 1775]|nr:hypothetical protein GY45DRAFT_1369313 [Cubamyces sp. BRFM 1775]
MAFVLASDTTLARDLWPASIARLKQERDVSAATLPAVRKVPTGVEHIAQWLWIDQQPELSQALVFVQGEGAADSSQELLLRVQGAISEMNLAVAGDWDGTEVNARKATQRLVLGSGGCPAAFDPQVEALQR